MKIIFSDKKVTIHSDTLGTIDGDSLLMYRIAKLLTENAIPDTYKDSLCSTNGKDARVLVFDLDGE